MCLYITCSISPKPTRSRQQEADTGNQPDILKFYNVKKEEEKQKKLKVLRDETFGVNVGHLRRLARLGGVVPLGEMAFDKLMCEICGKGDDEDLIVICDKCNKGFHLYCLTPILPSVPSGDWFCSKCCEKKQQQYRTVRRKLEESQSLIVDFFKLERPIPVVSKYELRSSTIKASSIMTAVPSTSKRSGYLKCYNPSTNPEKIKNQHVALASAMYQQGIAYSYDLVYKDGCKPSMNDVKFDEQRHLLREMCKSDRAVYDTTKRLAKEGYMVPVIVRQDKIQGFVVIADEAIKKDTLLTEYIGEVDILAKNEQNSNDSIMDLLRSG